MAEVPIIAVEDIVAVRYRAPDLDLMERFMSDFGLRRVRRTERELHMNGCGPDPFVHVTEKGDTRAIGFTFKVRSAEELKVLSSRCGQEIVGCDGPGGGHCVVLEDPDGNRVEVVHGATPAPVSARRTPFAANLGQRYARSNDVVRVESGPSQVMRLGHVALYTAKFSEMHAFYQDVLGLRDSDAFHAGDPARKAISFMHCGLGQQFVDHHTIALIDFGRTGFDHSAFEVLDLDDLMAGNQYLKSRERWKHSWGIGRHIAGSQIFDYWRDPFGNKVEHWTDGDRVNDAYPQAYKRFDPATDLAQWGPPPTADFFD